jgi:hypothetical protein
MQDCDWHVECSLLRHSGCLPLLGWLQGMVHLTDPSGIPKPPLRQPGDEDLQDPFVLAYRRCIAVVPGAHGLGAL